MQAVDNLAQKGVNVLSSDKKNADIEQGQDIS